jgi:hypothetical protein
MWEVDFLRKHQNRSNSVQTLEASMVSIFLVTNPQDSTNMTELEKKRIDLQMRVYKVQVQVSSNIHLWVFRQAEECVEASELLNKANIKLAQRPCLVCIHT